VELKKSHRDDLIDAAHKFFPSRVLFIGRGWVAKNPAPVEAKESEIAPSRNAESQAKKQRGKQAARPKT
jgi:hypothetical protein